MAGARMPPTDEARTVFRELGYTLDGDGTDFVARRKWRRVRVLALGADDAADPGPVLGADDEIGGNSSPMAEDAAGRNSPPAADDEDLRCYVTWREAAADLCERVRSLEAGGDWAVVGVDADGDHEVLLNHSS